MHSFNMIDHFLWIYKPDICKQECISIDMLIAGLQVIMTHKVSKFGNTFGCILLELQWAHQVEQAWFNLFLICLPLCLSTLSYPSTVDWNSLYHGLLNVSLFLTQVSLSSSLFSLKSSYFEYVPILDPILPRSTHDCFAWIVNFNPVLLQNNLFCYSLLYLVY
jgi:hypothetical protein